MYNFLTGGEVINDIERLQEAKGLLRILGTERIPDPTTAGDFLVRFGKKDIEAFQGSLDQIQDSAFSLFGSKEKRTGNHRARFLYPPGVRAEERGSRLCLREHLQLQRAICHSRRNRRCSAPGTEGRQVATAVSVFLRYCPAFSTG